MKLNFLAILLLGFIISCQKNEQNDLQTNPKVLVSIKEDSLIKDIKRLQEYASSYAPDKIDFSDNKALNKFDIDYIYNNAKTKKEIKDKITNILLLKQYLFHLTNFNQGYDLMTMRKGQAKFIIDYFLASNKISTEKEFLNSGYPYIVLSNKDILDEEIINLIKDITIQRAEITKQ